MNTRLPSKIWQNWPLRAVIHMVHPVEYHLVEEDHRVIEDHLVVEDHLVEGHPVEREVEEVEVVVHLAVVVVAEAAVVVVVAEIIAA